MNIVFSNMSIFRWRKIFFFVFLVSSFIDALDIKNLLNRTDIYIAKTIDGKFCSIPFVYKGKTYHDCTSEGRERPWCSLDKVFVEEKSSWNFCVPHPKEFKGCLLGSPNVTSEEVEEILREHNLARAKKPAVQMRKMEWNSELAQKAQAAAEKCLHIHVEGILCGNRYETGQNLYYNYWDKYYPDQITWSKVINFWNREEKDYNLETLTCAENKLCEHYTQVVWAKSGQVGCGKAYCHGPMYGDKNNIQYSIQYICNYFDSGNFGGFPPYIETKGDRCQNCFTLDTTRKFRCDQDKLCEACQNDLEGCMDLNDINTLAEKGKICLDTSPDCNMNKNICDLEKSGVWLPPPFLEFIKKCNRTCNRC